MKKITWIILIVILLGVAVATREHLVRFYDTIAQVDLLKVENVDLRLKLAASASNVLGVSRTNRDTILLLGGRSDTTNKNDVFSTGNLQTWNLISPSTTTGTTKWSPRMNANVVYFRNMYWVVGTSHWNSPSNGIVSPPDIWKSSDGVTWNLVNSTPPFNNYYAPFTSEFSGYYEYRAVTFRDKLYVVGGKPGNNTRAVVWSSSDGVIWNVETASAPFESRTLFSLVSFNDSLYVIGGRYSMNSYGNSGVWKSSDGITWTQVTASPAFTTALSNAKVLNYDGKMYLLGGILQTATSGSQSTKIWSSSDGATWTLVSSALPGSSRTGFDIRDAAVANGLLWVGDAAYSGNTNSIWSSSDGITWVQNRTTPGWSARYGYRFLVNR